MKPIFSKFRERGLRPGGSIKSLMDLGFENDLKTCVSEDPDLRNFFCLYDKLTVRILGSDDSIPTFGQLNLNAFERQKEWRVRLLDNIKKWEEKSLLIEKWQLTQLIIMEDEYIWKDYELWKEYNWKKLEINIKIEGQYLRNWLGVLRRLLELTILILESKYYVNAFDPSEVQGFFNPNAECLYGSIKKLEDGCDKLEVDISNLALPPSVPISKSNVADSLNTIKLELNTLKVQIRFLEAMQKKCSGKFISIDCEMVESTLGEEVVRLACVNEDLETIFKCYLKPKGRVIDYRERLTGVCERDILNAPSLEFVRDRVEKILSSQRIVGHSVRHDLTTLGITYKERNIRDTAELPIFLRSNGDSRKLKELALKYLGKTIQDETHDPEIDARVAMELYKKYWNIEGPAPRTRMHDRHVRCRQ